MAGNGAWRGAIGLHCIASKEEGHVVVAQHLRPYLAGFSICCFYANQYIFSPSAGNNLRVPRYHDM